MEFRKMVTITLYTRQQKRHWCIEQSFGLFGRGTGWDDLGEWHWNMYNIMCEMACQSKFYARCWMLGAGALGRPGGMVCVGGRKARDGEHMCAPSWTLLPPHTIPLGHPSAPAPSIQHRASNLDWQLVSYMILYMFKCHSPKSFHPLPLPQSP